MTELSERNRALVESLIPPERITTVDGGLHLSDWGQLNRLLDAAREIEAEPPPSYDGSKSLGERLYEAVSGAFGLWPWSEVKEREGPQWETAALNFTTRLSDNAPSADA